MDSGVAATESSRDELGAQPDRMSESSNARSSEYGNIGCCSLAGCCSANLHCRDSASTDHLKLSQVAADQAKSPPRSKTYDLEAKNLNYAIPRQLKRVSEKVASLFFCRGAKAEDPELKTPTCCRVLHDISFHAKPGEILAIAGPSGAGKSTLLEILSGRIRPSSGSKSILVNNQPMRVAQFRRISGYVMQHDALFPLLTVYEMLMFSAHLRLPSSMPGSEKASRVQMLMAELGLGHVAGSRIGSDRIRGISGGERRRVSIGVDVIHDPAVLLLDEPTSGLDSHAALHVMRMLRAMAETHQRTVVLSIHQPSYRILELFHSILLLSHGSVVHHGSLDQLASRLASAGHRIPPQINVLEYAIDAISDRMLNPMAKSAIASFLPSSSPNSGRQPNTIAALMKSESNDHMAVDDHKIKFANSRGREVAILAQRFAKILIRTKQLFAARSIQAGFAGLGMGSIFFRLPLDVEGIQERLGFLAFTLTFLLSSTTEALPLYLEEREIVMRESSRGAYRISSYVIANTLVFLPFLLMFSLLYSGPVYWLVGLNPTISAFLFFVMVIWLIVVMSNSFVAFFSALVPDFIMGNSLISGVVGAFFLFSGYFISKERIPKYWIFMHYLSFFKYPLDALLINEYSGLEDKCFGLAMVDSCTFSGRDALVQAGLYKENKWMDVLIMIFFAIAYRFLCYSILLIKSRHKKR